MLYFGYADSKRDTDEVLINSQPLENCFNECFVLFQKVLCFLWVKINHATQNRKFLPFDVGLCYRAKFLTLNEPIYQHYIDYS